MPDYFPSESNTVGHYDASTLFFFVFITVKIKFNIQFL